MRRIRIIGIVAAGTLACLFASGCGGSRRPASHRCWPNRCIRSPLPVLPATAPTATLSSQPISVRWPGSARHARRPGSTLLTATNVPEEVPHIPPPPQPVLDGKAPQRLTAGQEPTASVPPAPCQRQRNSNRPRPLPSLKGCSRTPRITARSVGRCRNGGAACASVTARSMRSICTAACLRLVGADFDKLR